MVVRRGKRRARTGLERTGDGVHIRAADTYALISTITKSIHSYDDAPQAEMAMSMSVSSNCLGLNVVFSNSVHLFVSYELVRLCTMIQSRLGH